MFVCHSIFPPLHIGEFFVFLIGFGWPGLSVALLIGLIFHFYLNVRLKNKSVGSISLSLCLCPSLSIFFCIMNIYLSMNDMHTIHLILRFQFWFSLSLSKYISSPFFFPSLSLFTSFSFFLSSLIQLPSTVNIIY